MLLNPRWLALVFLLFATACGGSVDTGFLRIEEAGTRVGYTSWNSDEGDRWCLFAAPLPVYIAPSVTNPDQAIRFRYLGKESLPGRPAGEPMWNGASRRLDADVTETSVGGSTAASGAHAPPLKPQPFGIGRYRLEQRPGATYEEVGALIVEPFNGETRQHWFFFGGAVNPPGNKAPYRAPSASDPDVTTRFVYVSGEVYSVGLTGFRDGLGFTPSSYERVDLTENNF